MFVRVGTHKQTTSPSVFLFVCQNASQRFVETRYSPCPDEESLNRRGHTDRKICYFVKDKKIEPLIVSLLCLSLFPVDVVSHSAVFVALTIKGRIR